MRLPRYRFRRLVQEAVEGLPPEIKNALDNLAILVQDWPTREQLKSAGVEDPQGLFGLHEGASLKEDPSRYYPLPNKITIFQRPLEEACATQEELLREVRITLLHEVGHYLGWGEKELEERGYG